MISLPAYGRTLFVDGSRYGTPNPSGMSWARAFPTIQQAIDFAYANPGFEGANILVAEGTYYPTTEGHDANGDPVIGPRERVIRLKAAHLGPGLAGFIHERP